MENIEKYLFLFIILSVIIAIIYFFLSKKNNIVIITNDLLTDLTNKIESYQLNNIRGMGTYPIFWTPDKKYYDTKGNRIKRTAKDLYNDINKLGYEPTPREYLENIGVGSIIEYIKDIKLGLCVINTIIPSLEQSDYVGGRITKIAYLNGNIYTKTEGTNNTWTNWLTVSLTIA